MTFFEFHRSSCSQAEMQCFAPPYNVRTNLVCSKFYHLQRWPRAVLSSHNTAALSTPLSVPQSATSANRTRSDQLLMQVSLLTHRPMRVNLPGHHGGIPWSIRGLWYMFKLASSYLLLHVRSGHVSYCMNSYGETYMIRRHISNHSTYVPTNRCYAILI